MNIVVVPISGKQGSGKSTLEAELKHLVTEYSEITQTKMAYSCEIFAGAIYEMHDFCRNLLKNHGIEPKGVKDGPLLQYLGTEWGRGNFGDDIWVNIVRAKIKALSVPLTALGVKTMVVVIPDCRFKNELEVWPGSLNVRLECDEATRKRRCSMWRENTNHPSEIDLDDSVSRFQLVFDSAATSSQVIATKVFSEILRHAQVPKA